MQKIFIGGVQGVGKTTVTKLLIENNSSLGRFSFGERMTDIAKTDITDYNGFHLLSDDQREEIVQKTRNQLATILGGENYTNLLFDNHFTIVRGNLIQNTFDDEEIKFYDKIVLLHSGINDIIQKILKDGKKERVELAKNYDFIKKHQELEIERAKFLSNKYNIEILEILNINLTNTLEQIEKLKQAKAIDIAELIKVAGMQNTKAEKITQILKMNINFEELKKLNQKEITEILLTLPGIGQKATDCILLLGLDLPSFVIDINVFRVIKRLFNIDPENLDYTKNKQIIEIKKILEDNLPRDTKLFQILHTYYLLHGKYICKSKPECSQCKLSNECMYYKNLNP